MILYFRPKPGRLGVLPAFLGVPNVGTITANVTNRYNVGTPARACAFMRFSAVCTTVGADADGALLARVVKYDATADAEVTLSQDINLETLVTREVGYADPVSTLTDAQRTIRVGDSLQVHVVSNSAAIDTQPTLLSFAVEVAVLE